MQIDKKHINYFTELGNLIGDIAIQYKREHEDMRFKTLLDVYRLIIGDSVNGISLLFCVRKLYLINESLEVDFLDKIKNIDNYMNKNRLNDFTLNSENKDSIDFNLAFQLALIAKVHSCYIFN